VERRCCCSSKYLGQDPTKILELFFIFPFSRTTLEDFSVWKKKTIPRPAAARTPSKVPAPPGLAVLQQATTESCEQEEMIKWSRHTVSEAAAVSEVLNHLLKNMFKT
jgi:hypothetical protein